MENIAIKVEGLSKVYKIFDKPIDRLKESLNPLHKRYSKDFYALKDLSFEIKKGETVGIIGKNGAGKSTLLKLITGVLTPSCGEIKVNGRIASLLELGAGFNPEMTGIENVYMNGMLMGCEKHEMDQRLSSIIDFADIGDFINQPVKMYSSGMFARLAFAVNAFVEPDILIVDEALSVGDGAFQAKCITRMRQMIQSGVTVLFVTHDMSIVKNFCKQCIYLNHGEIEISGAAEYIADVYLRNTRDEMNGPQRENNQIGLYDTVEIAKTEGDMKFKMDLKFTEKVKLFRQGTAEVQIMAFDVLNMEGETLTEAAFNQQIVLRIYLQFEKDMAVGVGYHIRDDKNVEIIGSYLTLESNKLLSGKKNERYIVEFVTRVPLIEGIYNFTLVVSQPLDKTVTSVQFVDLIENAYIIKVKQREHGRIWNKVYLPVDYKIEYVGENNNEIVRKKCACCGSKDIKYQRLSNYYTDNWRKYGCETLRWEMLSREEYDCPVCGAADRERAYALWLERNLDKYKKYKILDIAPAKAIGGFIKRKFPNIEYKTADLFMPDVDYCLDIMDMQEIENESIDFFICSHVLEHVVDDKRAMIELKRVLKTDGRGILVVPLDLNQMEIDEDPSVEDISERWKRFAQDDHIRKYTKQIFLERVKESGFAVKECGLEYFGENAFAENGLLETSVVYIVSRG